MWSPPDFRFRRLARVDRVLFLAGADFKKRIPGTHRKSLSEAEINQALLSGRVSRRAIPLSALSNLDETLALNSVRRPVSAMTVAQSVRLNELWGPQSHISRCLPCGIYRESKVIVWVRNGVSPYSIGPKAVNAESSRIEQELPVANVNPAAEFVSDLPKLSHLRETKLFMKGNTGIVRECNASHHCVEASIL